jgi:hypothetical protein
MHDAHAVFARPEPRAAYSAGSAAAALVRLEEEEEGRRELNTRRLGGRAARGREDLMARRITAGAACSARQRMRAGARAQPRARLAGAEVKYRATTSSLALCISNLPFTECFSACKSHQLLYHAAAGMELA